MEQSSVGEGGSETPLASEAQAEMGRMHGGTS